MKLIIDIPEGHYEPFKIGKYTIVGGLRGNGKTLMSALCMAIANATPLTESDDCVSREAVIKLVKKGEYDITGETDNEMFLEEVNKLPSVQPNREKHDEEVIKETVESIWGKPPYTEVLDKIRAEIEGKCFDVSYKNQAFDYGLKIVKWSDVREIIDKYKAESEDNDADSN